MPAEDWLVVVDAQSIFADATSPWSSPMWAAALPHIRRLAEEHGPERTVFTRFVADPSLGGSWERYYEDWSFALVPDADPMYAIVPELSDLAQDASVVTAGTFGKWTADLVTTTGPHPGIVLAGVSTDCCVLSTALPAADAGATVRVVADACAGSTPDNHRRALDAMALYGPQITVV